MFDFSDALSVFAYVGLLLVLLIGFATVSYLAYAEGKKKRRRSRYGRPKEQIADSYFVDAASALAVVSFPAWAVHGYSVIQSASSSESSYVSATSLWAVVAYWAVAWMIGFGYVRLLRREIPVSSVWVFAACLASVFWFVWGFQPLNDWFLQFSGG